VSARNCRNANGIQSVPSSTTRRWLVVGIVVAYLLSRFLDPGASYLEVFRFAGTVAFAAYAMALWQNSIWYKRSWGTTLKSTFDGLVYALVTAGIFGWRWPA